MNLLSRALPFLLFLVHSTSFAQVKKPLAPHPVTAFVHVNVITMADSVPLMDQTVIVRDEVIAEIGPSASVDVPENALRIEGAHQKYLVPGLVDTHVHLHKPKAEEWIAAFVAHGVTTVINLKGNRRILALREKARKKRLFAPDIYTSGPFIGAKTSWFDKTSPKDLERLALGQKKAGYDMVKIHGDLPLASYQHLMEFSRAHDIFVMGHIPRNLSFQDAIDVRQLSLAHAEEMIYTQFSKLDTAEIAPFAKQAGDMGMWLTCTLTAFNTLSKSWADPSVIEAVMELPETKSLHPTIQKIYKQDWYGRRDLGSRSFFQKANAFHTPLVTAMYRSGVKLLLGTDAPMPAVPPGISLHNEIDLMLEMGMSPYETLQMGTGNAGEYVAKHIDKQAKFGKVKEGYRANLLLLSGNPLEDMRLLRDPVGVMLGGSWYEREYLKEATTW